MTEQEKQAASQRAEAVVKQLRSAFEEWHLNRFDSPHREREGDFDIFTEFNTIAECALSSGAAKREAEILALIDAELRKVKKQSESYAHDKQLLFGIQTLLLSDLRKLIAPAPAEKGEPSK